MRFGGPEPAVATNFRKKTDESSSKTERMAALLPLALSQSKRFSGVAVCVGIRVVAR
jgi:hypothetical protein